jgi:putative transposase
MTLKLVDRAFKSFFGKLKSENVKDKSKVKIPKYLKKDGRQVCIFTKQTLWFSEKGFVRLAKIKTLIPLPEGFSKEKILLLQIVPKVNHISVEFIYSKDEKPQKENDRFAGIDLGVNNLAALTSNVFAPVIFSGKPLKSVNHFYNKRKAKLTSESKNVQTNRIKRLHRKRNNKVKDYLHKISRKIVNHLVSNDIGTLIIGYSKGWKQETNLGKVNNQNFVSIPHLTFVNMLKYKCELEGIKVVLQEEAYTSKCSFFDNEEIGSHESYLGKRVKRGLFLRSSGSYVNADVNASYNIIKKATGREKEWFFLNSVQASVMPLVARP